MDTIQKQQILEEYCGNEMARLKQICSPIIYRKGIPQMEEDDLYSAAQETLLDSVERYDASQNCTFKTFLVGNIRRTFYDWTRDRQRGKRCNRKRDENGRPVKDEKGHPIIIPDISLDMFIEDGVDLAEKVASDFDMEEVLSEKLCFDSDERVKQFLQSLSELQRQIVEMKMEGIPVSRITEQLQITKREYDDAMQSVRENRLVTLFNKNAGKQQRKQGDGQMKQNFIIGEEDFVMELDTTDNHRVDARSLESLLKEKMEGELDCNYISQRAPFQWSEEQVNKFYSRLLNNQPIPEIVVCETVENGEKISYLVEGLQRMSYAEEFKENRLPVKAKGAEFTKVKYKKYEYDEEGKKVLDENGRAKFSIDVFNITNKYYKELPEFLQNRFNNFNITVTRYFNCSYEIIDYHIRNYNNHQGMTKSHYGITSVSNHTSRNIKELSQRHPFFLNHVKCTNKSRKKGALEELVARSIMTTFFLEDWKKELIDTLKYIDKNALDEQFIHFTENLDRLAKAADKSVQDLFNTTNAHIWLAVFDKFTRLKLEDNRFIEFMYAFKESLHGKKINGRSYDSVNTRNTKDKSSVKNKIGVLLDLMLDYLQIEKEIFESEQRKPDFNEAAFALELIKENVEEDSSSEDVELYKLSLEDYTVEIDEETKQAVDKNAPAFVALVAYAFSKDIDNEIPGWLVDLTNRKTICNQNQKELFLHIKQDFMEYLKRKGRAA